MFGREVLDSHQLFKVMSLAGYLTPSTRNVTDSTNNVLVVFIIKRRCKPVRTFETVAPKVGFEPTCRTLLKFSYYLFSYFDEVSTKVRKMFGSMNLM